MRGERRERELAAEHDIKIYANMEFENRTHPVQDEIFSAIFKQCIFQGPMKLFDQLTLCCLALNSPQAWSISLNIM
jgi:hypothetical protein